MKTDLNETGRNCLETNSGTGTLISYFGAGVIDEVVLVRKALTQAEIQESKIIQAPSKRKLIEGTENMSQQNPGKCIESHWTATKATTYASVSPFLSLAISIPVQIAAAKTDPIRT